MGLGRNSVCGFIYCDIIHLTEYCPMLRIFFYTQAASQGALEGNLFVVLSIVNNRSY